MIAQVEHLLLLQEGHWSSLKRATARAVDLPNGLALIVFDGVALQAFECLQRQHQCYQE